MYIRVFNLNMLQCIYMHYISLVLYVMYMYIHVYFTHWQLIAIYTQRVYRQSDINSTPYQMYMYMYMYTAVKLYRYSSLYESIAEYYYTCMLVHLYTENWQPLSASLRHRHRVIWYQCDPTPWLPLSVSPSPGYDIPLTTESGE